MKRLSFAILITASCFSCFGQTEALTFERKLLSHENIAKTEFKEELSKHDFSKLFAHSDNSVIYGAIGNHYQRIRIKLITIRKDSLSPETYHIYGKSMVKNNIDEFNGTITISTIRKLKTMSYGVDDEYKNKGIKGEYIILANYTFSENKNQPHSGTFKGTCESDFYLDKNNRVQYDDIDLNSDGYTNNQFIGQWASYETYPTL